MRRLVVAALAAAAAWMGQAGAQDQATTPVTYVQAGRLLADPGDGKVLTAQTLVVQDGRILRIETGYTSAPGGRVVDLRDSFVLPGLIDSHVHLTQENGPEARSQEVTLSKSDQAMFGVLHAKRTLEAGFTTVVDLAAENEAIFALRDAVAKGWVEGPRILAAGYAVNPEGGHADVHGWRPEVMAALESPAACSGADACRKVVRKQIQAGADVIKIMATGGVLDQSSTGVDQQLTDEEMKAIVETAHAMGRQVAAHAHGTAGINAALRAGVDSIEHGTYLDDTSIALFKKTGAYLVPTVVAGVTVAEEAGRPGTWMSPQVRAKALQVGPNMLAMARRAHVAGVKMAFGTDSAVSPHGKNAREFVLLVQAGFTPLDAIRMATVWGAAHDRLSDEIGRLKPGMAADVIAVKGDPLSDVSELQRVSFVMKGGTVYKP